MSVEAEVVMNGATPEVHFPIRVVDRATGEPQTGLDESDVPFTLIGPDGVEEATTETVTETEAAGEYIVAMPLADFDYRGTHRAVPAPVDSNHVVEPPGPIQVVIKTQFALISVVTDSTNLTLGTMLPPYTSGYGSKVNLTVRSGARERQTVGVAVYDPGPPVEVELDAALVGTDGVTPAVPAVGDLVELWEA